MNLIRAEARRLVKRRLTGGLLAIVIALLAFTVALVALDSQRPDAETRERAEAAAAAAHAEEQEWLQTDYEDCQRVREEGLLPGEEDYYPADCAEILTWGTPQDEMVAWHLPPTFDFAADSPAMLRIWAGLLAMYAFLVGASFIGAEWRSGGLLNLLLWQPRRWVVFGAKIGTLLAALTGLGLVSGAVWTGSLWLAAAGRGVTDGMTGELWRAYLLLGLRGIALVLFAGAVGYAMASLGRHTAAALGAVVAAFVVGVIGVAAVLAVLGTRFLEAWLWPTYVAAWLSPPTVLRDWVDCGPDGACTEVTMEIGWQRAGLVLGVVLVGLVLAAGWQMRRRDVN